MTADERMALIRAKSERAEKHVRELEAELRAFLDSRPYVVGAKREPRTGQLVYYVVSVRETPVTIPLIIGDVLQCLRSSLDHLAYQLLLVAGRPPDDPDVRFPVGRHLQAYQSQRGRMAGRIRQDAIDAIDAVEPYAGGKGALLWTLHDLNNVDKHRTILTAGAALESADLGRHLVNQMRKLVTSSGRPFPDSLEMPLFIRPADKGFPLRAGYELLVLGPEDEPDDKQQFRFEVAFAESAVVEGKPVGPTLREMASLIKAVVTSFASKGLLA